jgi:hypothetical protein
MKQNKFKKGNDFINYLLQKNKLIPIKLTKKEIKWWDDFRKREKEFWEKENKKIKSLKRSHCNCPYCPHNRRIGT